MKLSNKLLIGLSLLVYIVPLSAYISYRSGGVDAKDFHGSIEQESKSFNAATKYLKSEKLNPFKSIQLVGNERIQLHLIKDDAYGLKLVENKYNDANVSYGNADELIIHINSTSYLANQVFIYAPRLNEITLNGVSLDNFVAKQDSITINVIGGSNNFSLGNNETLKFARLNFTKSNVNLILGKGLQHLDLQLKDSEIVSNISSLNRFALIANNSVYSMKKPDQQIAESNAYLGLVKNFSIQTEGKTIIWIPEKLKIEQVEGNLSDSTYINLPITSLKKLIKESL